MKKLALISAGTIFEYGGTTWVKLEDCPGTALVLAAECVRDSAFDEEGVNDWQKSTLSQWLNGEFLESLCEKGADRADFADIITDLTADDGMTDYGLSTNKVTLITCDLYRKYRALIPAIDDWWWTATPWTCNPSHSYGARYVRTAGALANALAYRGNGGVRPLCNLKSDILVYIPGEVENETELHTAAINEIHDAVLNLLKDYPTDIWGNALAFVVSSLINAKVDACDALEEAAAIKRERYGDPVPPVNE